jgi:hypothetical protein
MTDLTTRLLALAEKAVDEALELDYGDPEDRYIYRELQELRQLVLQPVPVSERLPGPEDCDSEGSCWWYDPRFVKCWWYLEACNHAPYETHWLPHHALPLPTK